MGNSAIYKTALNENAYFNPQEDRFYVETLLNGRKILRIEKKPNWFMRILECFYKPESRRIGTITEVADSYCVKCIKKATQENFQDTLSAIANVLSVIKNFDVRQKIHSLQLNLFENVFQQHQTQKVAQIYQEAEEEAEKIKTSEIANAKAQGLLLIQEARQQAEQHRIQSQKEIEQQQKEIEQLQKETHQHLDKIDIRKKECYENLNLMREQMKIFHDVIIICKTPKNINDNSIQNNELDNVITFNLELLEKIPYFKLYKSKTSDQHMKPSTMDEKYKQIAPNLIHYFDFSSFTKKSIEILINIFVKEKEFPTNLAQEELLDLYLLCDFLNLAEMQKICVNDLESRNLLNKEFAIEILTYFSSIESQPTDLLRCKACQVIAENFKDWETMKAYESLSTDIILQIIENEDLAVNEEYDIYAFFKQWVVNSDLDLKKMFAENPRLLDALRIEYFNKDQICKMTLEDGVDLSSHQYRSFVTNNQKSERKDRSQLLSISKPNAFGEVTVRWSPNDVDLYSTETIQSPQFYFSNQKTPLVLTLRKTTNKTKYYFGIRYITNYTGIKYSFQSYVDEEVRVRFTSDCFLNTVFTLKSCSTTQMNYVTKTPLYLHQWKSVVCILKKD